MQGTQTVRYGSGSSWVVKSVSDGGECSNSGFGNDPLVGVVKECQIAATWTPIADEHQAFSVQGTQTVRYGIGAKDREDRQRQRRVQQRVVCSDRRSDVKVCQGAAAARSNRLDRVAGEGGTSGNGTQTVPTAAARLGHEDVDGGGQCTNEGSGSTRWSGSSSMRGVAASAVAPSPSPSPAPSRAPTPPTHHARAVAHRAGADGRHLEPAGRAHDTSSTSPASGRHAGHCTEAALRAAVASRDVITFSCGADGPIR